MLSKTELLYTLALQRTPNLGDTSAKKLLHHVGSAEGIFKEKPSNLLKIHGIGSFKVRQLQQKNLLDLATSSISKRNTNLSWGRNCDQCQRPGARSV